MLRLSQFDLDVLTESHYLRDCGSQHLTCWCCLGHLHAGMLVHQGPQGAAHTRCLVSTRNPHQLHALIHCEGR